jgi:hypothetical protein
MGAEWLPIQPRPPARDGRISGPTYVTNYLRSLAQIERVGCREGTRLPSLQFLLQFLMRQNYHWCVSEHENRRSDGRPITVPKLPVVQVLIPSRKN